MATNETNSTCNAIYNDTVTYSYSVQYTTLNLVLERYVYPIIFTLGMAGNLVSFFIWIQPKMRNSCGYYFASLAIAEILVLVVHVPFSTVPSVFKALWLKNSTMCEVFSVLFVASECWTIYLLMAMTVDRFIIVCYPMKKHRFCTKKRTIIVIVSLGVLALFFGFVQGGFWEYDKSIDTCGIPMASVRQTEGFHMIFVAVWSSVMIVLVVIVPIGVIFGFNTAVAVSLQKMKKRRQRMVARTTQQCLQTGGGPSRYDTEQTIILFYLSGYLVLSEAPDAIMYLLCPLFPHPDLYYQANHTPCETIRYAHTYNRYALASTIIEAFSLTNYAVSILIYSLSGHKFRTMLLKTCKGCCTRRNRDFELA